MVVERVGTVKAEAMGVVVRVEAVKAAVGAGAVEYAWGKAKQFRRDIGPK